MTALIADVRNYVPSNFGDWDRIREAFAWHNSAQALAGWDVSELFDSGFNNPSRNVYNSLIDWSHHRDVFASQGSLPGTVTWYNRVWDADDVNYYFFGVLVRALDDAQGVSTAKGTAFKAAAYRTVVEQGDKAFSRCAMFAAGYNGVPPDPRASVGGPVIPSTISYSGKLTWEVVSNGQVVVQHKVP